MNSVQIIDSHHTKVCPKNLPDSWGLWIKLWWREGLGRGGWGCGSGECLGSLDTGGFGMWGGEEVPGGREGNCCWDFRRQDGEDERGV